MDRFLFSLLFISSFAIPNIKAQQNYSGNSVMDCDISDATGPSSAFLYTCNGKRSCQAYLIFTSQYPYNTISSVSKLTSSDPGDLARLNNISSFPVFPTGKEVIVPVTCSCSGQYYQANTSYVIASNSDTYFTIANDTYQGLTTCNSLMRENSYGEFDLDIGMELRVPLRCACPTSNQTANGTKYMLTYLVGWGDKVGNVSDRFNVSTRSVRHANGFAEDNPTLFPFTTILIPLSAEPSSSETTIHYPEPPYVSPFVPVHLVRKSSKRLEVWIIVGISLLVLCFVLSMVLLLHRKRRYLDARKSMEGKGKSGLPVDFLDQVARVDEGLKIYTFEELKAATDDFSPENRLSESVYRGVIGDDIVAIKKMSKGVSHEVNLLRKINHFSLISLHAACEHQDVFYLVYEYMENGSLRDWLREGDSPAPRSWSRRIQIALDVANGLHYIHNFTDPPYVHKDISGSNVLLSRHFRAKIANFSLARSAKTAEYVNSSMRLASGANGYMAPEYIEYGFVTPEIDIYAFGVILLELITGKEAVFTQDEREVELAEAVISAMEAEDAKAELGSLVDPRLQAMGGMEHILLIVKLSLACLTEDPERRPTSGEIVASLLKIQLDMQRSDSIFIDRI